MKFIERSWKIQRNVETRFSGLGRGKYGRILRMARKPTTEEYMRTCQIVGIGLGIVGALGFLIYLGWTNMPAITADTWNYFFGG